MNSLSKRHKALLSVGVIGWLMSGALYAATPVWTYSVPNPAKVSVAKTGTATVEYTVTNQSRKSKNLLLKSTAGLSASSCYLAGKGSTCTLTLTVNGSSIPRAGLHQGPIMCEQGNSNQCYQPSHENQLNITLENSPSSSVAYIANALANEILRCDIASNGNLINCNPETTQIISPSVLLINSSKTILYVMSRAFTDGYYQCNILPGGHLGPCEEQSLLAFGDRYVGLAINAKLNQGYVLLGDSGVIMCAINAEGTLHSCIDVLSSSAERLNIQLNKESTWSYMSQTNDSILKCAVNPNGSFGACSQTGPVLAFPFITLNAASTLAYITSLSDNQILRCNILANGDLDNCNSTGTGFNGPAGIAFNASGTVAYVVNALGNTVSQCVVDGQGALNDCVATGNNLNTPFAIAIL